ncbi:MAG: hypothetical protein PHS84_04325 [Paludibacter sp.]|nr:hypothetical protein [Paludibacter sp.]
MKTDNFIKTLKLLFCLTIIAYISFSCSVNPIPEVTVEKYSYIISDTTIYWNRNTLKQLNLKGNIKSVTYYNRTYIFNQEGYLITITNGQSVSQYKYDSKNRLNTINNSDNEGMTTFNYNNTGKFIPYDPYIDYTLIQSNFIKYFPSKYIPILIQNLSSVKTTTQFRKYQFINDSTLQILINTAYSIDQDTLRDTAIVKYHGVYPISMLYTIHNISRLKFLIDNIKYTANGMFSFYTDYGSLLYEENFSDHKTPWTNYQFLNNNNYLTPTVISEGFNNYYFYNKYFELEKDSILAGNVFNVQKYTNYVFDQYFNWHSRDCSLNNSQSVNQVRTFTYW